MDADGPDAGPGSGADSPADDDGPALARAYYRAVDAGDWESLAGLLDAGFVHDRPDSTLEGSERFLAFMREERPDPDTTHVVEAVYRQAERGADGASSDTRADRDTDADADRDADADARVAVEGRLLRADGSEWFRFVDVFAVTDGRLSSLVTYAR